MSTDARPARLAAFRRCAGKCASQPPDPKLLECRTDFSFQNRRQIESLTTTEQSRRKDEVSGLCSTIFALSIRAEPSLKLDAWGESAQRIPFLYSSECRRAASLALVSGSGQSFEFPDPRGSEFVADPMDRSKIQGIPKIRFELLTQAQDVIVDRPSAGVVVIAPDLIQEVVSGNHLVRVRNKILEDLEFHGSQAYWLVGSTNLHGR